jgi:hypothetical protein
MFLHANGAMILTEKAFPAQILSFVFMLLSPRKTSHNVHLQGQASVLRARSKQGRTALESEPETGETDDEFQISELENMPLNTEEEFPLRSPQPSPGTHVVLSSL